MDHQIRRNMDKRTRIFDSDIIVYRYADAILFDAEIKLAKMI